MLVINVITDRQLGVEFGIFVEELNISVFYGSDIRWY